jgi:hypothetical protein
MEEGNTIIARTVDSLTPVLFPWQKVDARLQAGLATLYRLAFVRGHDDAQARYDDGYRQGWIDATAVADAGAAP